MVPMSTRVDIIAAIEGVLMDNRGGQRRGDEIEFRCFSPEKHANGDARPSAAWNRIKQVWCCRVCGARGGYVNLARRLALELPGARAAARHVIERYDYVDEVGRLLFQVERLEPKGFRQRRPDGHGGWLYKLDDVRRVPYRLTELLAAPADAFVLLCEGERDVDTLYRYARTDVDTALKLVATCNPCGAGKWRVEYNEYLRDRQVVVIPDADEPGRRHADDVLRNLLPVAGSVRRLELSGAKDLADWLAVGHTVEELIALVASVPVIKKTTNERAHDSDRGRLTFTHVGALLDEPDAQGEWLLDGLLPAGGFAVLVGKPKAGKSTLARNLCKAVAHGEAFLGRAVRQGAVLYLALEEKRSQVKAHFRSLGVSPDAPLRVFVGTSPIDGLSQLRTELERVRCQGEPVALVIIDPMFRLVRPRDGNDYAAMTAALDPVLALARDSGACVLATHHGPKGERADVDSPIGSTAIAGSADVLLVLKRNDRYRTLSTVQRMGEDLPETVIELDPETRAIRTSGTRQEADVSGMKAAIVGHLVTVSEPVDEPAIDGAVEGRTRTKREALRALVTDAKVSRIGTGKKGDPYRYGIPCVSCSLVPCICREQENENPEPPESPRQSSSFSRSRNSAVSGDGREQESDREVIEV